MAGLHGKNAELRIATAEVLLSDLRLGTDDDGATYSDDGHTYNSITRIFRAPTASQNWKYDRNNTSIKFTDLSTDTEIQINCQTRLINYAGGAIWLGQYPSVSGVIAESVLSQTLSTIGSLIGDARQFTLSVSNDPLDSTTIGETWATFVEGLSKFEGSIDGLYIDDFWYKQAIASVSGIIPQKVLRLKPNPAYNSTYFQGAVIFPNWEISGGFDSVIEHTISFNGLGPLDHIIEGDPFFQITGM